MITKVTVHKTQKKISNALRKRFTYHSLDKVAIRTWYPVSRVTDIPTRDSTFVEILLITRDL